MIDNLFFNENIKKPPQKEAAQREEINFSF